ncbi:MAG TPA: RidA family protein [Thermoanaerobaculia bacterium]|nr:RidA family protein [Thermoanaerobaculia bacterium]
MILQPENWAAPIGYTNGVAVQGRQIFVAGQVGWNPATCQFEAGDLTAQVRQALENIVAVLKEAGAGPEHLVRLTWYITDKSAYNAARREIGRAWKDVIGRHYPPMSLVVVAALLEDRALVEIEATAVVPDDSSPGTRIP